MGSSTLMTLGTRAMFANYAALQTTGHNIANANTAGYSRQTVDLQTSGGQSTGAGFFGKGVDIATVTRAHDRFLTREAATARSMAAADEARLGQVRQLEKVFPGGETGLGYAAGQLLNAFSDVASRPGDASARQVVLSRAEELASKFRSAADQITSLQSGVTQDLRNSISAVNGLATQVASINGRIAAAIGSGHAPNDLLDQRDQLVSEISQYLQVSIVAADDGTQSVFLGGGQQLVLGSTALELRAVQDPYDASQVRLGVRDPSGDRMVPQNMITGGSIAGLMRFQDEDLAEARNLLGQLAASISSALNGQQALGLDLRQPPGSGAPLFSIGDPMVLPANTNARGADGNYLATTLDADGNRISTVSLTVVDARELRVSDYALRVHPNGVAGDYQLTRLSDGTALPGAAPDDIVRDGDVIDGFRLNVASPAPSGTDRFVLRPVGAAARDMERALADPRGLAAASPVTATTDAGNRGTASVASLQATSTTPNPVLSATQGIRIQFTSDTAYDIELVDSSTTPSTSSVLGSGTWTPGQPIRLSDTPPLEGWELRLNGRPQGPQTINGTTYPGDTISVEQTAFPAGNNGNALAMRNLSDALIVGQQTLSDGTVIAGTSVTDAYANALARIGLRVQTARSFADMSRTVATDAEATRANSAGVNLDEEAARLMQYQQSYQAAAKMLQVAQSVFDALLQVAGN